MKVQVNSSKRVVQLKRNYTGGARALYEGDYATVAASGADLTTAQADALVSAGLATDFTANSYITASPEALQLVRDAGHATLVSLL